MLCRDDGAGGGVKRFDGEPERVRIGMWIVPRAFYFLFWIAIPEREVDSKEYKISL